MYKVIIVDDEKLSRDSIAGLIDWEANGMRLTGVYKNAFEALDTAQAEAPDIVITDIKMPVMNGLELIARLKELSSDTAFIVVSGYDEYEYMSEAMRHGLKHYLLKPCNELDILEVLAEVKQEIAQRSRDREFLARLERDYQRILPSVKEQFLRDLALTGLLNQRDIDQYLAMFEIDAEACQLILVQFGEKCGYLEKFALKNIAEDLFTSERLFLSTIVEDGVLLLIEPMDFKALSYTLNQMREIYRAYYRMELYMSVSEAGRFQDIRSMYKEAQAILRYRFYFSEGCILTKEDVQFQSRQGDHTEYYAQFEEIALSVRAGDLAAAGKQLRALFELFEERRMDIEEVKMLCIELYMLLIRQGQEPTSDKMLQVVRIKDIGTLQATYEFLSAVTEEAASSNYRESASKQNRIISEVLDIIERNLDNPELSLSWIGKELLYMNVDYLGRLFTREIGMKFSQYVLERRMEKAIRLIEEQEELKIYEISKLTGFREDTPYFSKVFKKHTGMTPTEYKKQLEERKNRK